MSTYSSYKCETPVSSGITSVNASNSCVSNSCASVSDSWISPDVVIKGRLIVNGTDVSQTLEDAAKVLGVINRDPELEKRYSGLREIARQYEEALEKYKAFEAIKDSK